MIVTALLRTIRILFELARVLFMNVAFLVWTTMVGLYWIILEPFLILRALWKSTRNATLFRCMVLTMPIMYALFLGMASNVVYRVLHDHVMPPPWVIDLTIGVVIVAVVCEFVIVMTTSNLIDWYAVSKVNGGPLRPTPITTPRTTNRSNDDDTSV